MSGAIRPLQIGEARRFATLLSEYNDLNSVFSIPLLLREGRAIQDFSRPKSLIVGCDEITRLSKVCVLFESFCDGNDVIKTVTTKEAEFTCFARHAMLATRLSFMNEMANLAERSDVNIDVIREGIGLDPRVGSEYLYPGCGYGGSALSKNVERLASGLRVRPDDLGLLDVVAKINERQKDLLFRKIWRFFRGKLRGKVIAVWGTSFKPETDSVSASPALVLIESLLSQGCLVQFYDPMAKKNTLEYFSESPELVAKTTAHSTLENADVLVICTDWNEFLDPDMGVLAEKLKHKAIFDGRNILDSKRVEASGMKYFGIGKGEANF